MSTSYNVQEYFSPFVSLQLLKGVESGEYSSLLPHSLHPLLLHNFLFTPFFLPKLKKINAADDFEGRETALETKESQQIQQKLKAVKKEI